MNTLTAILSLLTIAFFATGVFHSNPPQPGESIAFSLNKSIKTGYGHSICFRGNGDFVACSSGQSHLFEKGKLKSSTQIFAYWAGNPQVSPDGKICYAGLNKVNLESGKNQYLDLERQFETGLKSSPQPGHFEVRYSAWSEDAKDLAVFVNYRNPRGIGVSSEYDGPRTRLLLLDGQSLKVRHVLRHDAGFSDRQVVTISDRHIAAADNTIRIWERESGKLLHTISTENAYCPSLCFDASGEHLAVGRVNGSIEVYEIGTGERVYVRPKLHRGRPMALAFHPDGDWLMSGGEDEVIYAINWKNKAETPVQLPIGDRIEGIAFSPKNKNEMYVSAKFRQEQILIYEVCID